MATQQRPFTIAKTGEPRTFGRARASAASATTTATVIVGQLDFSNATQSALLAALGII